MFQRAIDGVTYNCLRTGKDQYHLFETKPIKGNVHRVKYIRTHWENVNSERYRQKVPEKNLIVKKLPLVNQKDFENELRLQRKFSLNPSSVLAAQDDKFGYIVGEDFDFNLREYLNRNKNLSLEDRVQIILGLLNEVLLLEQQGILHRDLKPENICVKYNEKTKAWEVRIIDFGMSTPVSVTEITGGSVAYMSPDKKLSHASDRFSLGPIIAEILGCNIHAFMKERIKAHNDFDKLSEEAQLEYKFEQLPAYNMKALPVRFFPLKSNLRDNHIKLLDNLVSTVPEQRYSIEYLLHFFLQVHSAVKESNKGIVESASDALSEISQSASSRFNAFKDSVFGEKKETKSKKSVLSKAITSSTREIAFVLDDKVPPLERDFHALAEAKIRLSSAPILRSAEYLLLQSLLQYKDKFKESRSTGIKDIFKNIEQGCTVKETLKVLEGIGDEKTAPPSAFASCFSCFFTARNNNMHNVYQDFARLNKQGMDNADVLEEIGNKMARYTFV